MDMDGTDRKDKTDSHMVRKSNFGNPLAFRMDKSKTFTMDPKYYGNSNRIFSLQTRNVLFKADNQIY